MNETYIKRDRLRAVFLFWAMLLRLSRYNDQMEWALTFAALMCNPGDRLIDLSAKLPRAVKSVDVLISVEPFYTRLYVYQPGFPDSSKPCCRNQHSALLQLPVIDGRWCLRQSQPQMKWKLQIIARPDIAV